MSNSLHKTLDVMRVAALRQSVVLELDQIPSMDPVQRVMQVATVAVQASKLDAELHTMIQASGVINQLRSEARERKDREPNPAERTQP